MKKTNALKMILLALALISMWACSEMFLIDLTVKYPEDVNSENPATYDIDMDETMNNVDEVIAEQTKDSVVNIVKDSGKVPAEFGDSYTVDAVINLDQMMQLISGDDITITATVTAETPIGTQTDTVDVSANICDEQFRDKTVYSNETTTVTLQNYEAKCLQGQDIEIYMEVEHQNDVVAVSLSENEDLKDYIQYKNKIYSASVGNDLQFTIKELADGLIDDQGNAIITFSADVYMRKLGEEGSLYNISTKEDHWVGRIQPGLISKDSPLDIIFTYEGKGIIQKSLKNLDFEVGMLSKYIIKPYSKRPTGTLKTLFEGTFYFVIEPLN